MHKVPPPPHFRSRRCQHRLIICGSHCNKACSKHTQAQEDEPLTPIPPATPNWYLLRLLAVMAICGLALAGLFLCLLPDESAGFDGKTQIGFNPFKQIDRQINGLKNAYPDADKPACNLAILQLAAHPTITAAAMAQGQLLKEKKCNVDLAFRIDSSKLSQEHHAKASTSTKQNEPQPSKSAALTTYKKGAATLGTKPPTSAKPATNASAISDNLKSERSVYLIGSSGNWLNPLAESAIRAELFREYAYQYAVVMAKQAKETAEQDKKADDNKRDKFKTMLAAVLAVVLLIPLAIAFWRFLGYIVGDTHWLTGFHDSVAKSGENGADGKDSKEGKKDGKKDGGPSWLAMIPVITLSGATAIGAYHTLGPGIGTLPPANLTMPDSNLLNQLNQLNNLKAPEPDTGKFPGNDLKVIADAMLEQGRQQAAAIRELGNKQAEAAKTYAEAQKKTTEDLSKEMQGLSKLQKDAVDKFTDSAAKIPPALKEASERLRLHGLKHEVAIRALEETTVKAEAADRSEPKVWVATTEELQKCLDTKKTDSSAFLGCIRTAKESSSTNEKAVQ